jgi:tetratricopeptide (TPR) repeat protein
MTWLCHSDRRPVCSAAARSRTWCPGRPAALAAAALILAGGLAPAQAQKSYRYEDDPIRAGNKAIEEMRLDEAKANFEEAIESSYQVPKAKYGLAEVLVRTGRFEDAEALYREALDMSKREGEKSFAEAHAGLGVLLIESDRWEEGAQEVALARKQNGGYWPAIYGEARILIRDKKLEKAKAQLDYGASRKGAAQGEDLYHRGMAMFYLATNDLKEAETEALSALHINPSDPRHGRLVAYIYEKRNVPALAINACEEVMRTPGFTPTASFVHYTGTLYQKAERYNEARDRYLQAVELDSTYAPVLKDLAGLLRLAKQHDQASKVYLRYVELEPDDIEARVGLAESLNDAGR